MVDGEGILEEMAQNPCSLNDSTGLSSLVHQQNKILNRKNRLQCLDFSYVENTGSIKTFCTCNLEFSIPVHVGH